MTVNGVGHAEYVLPNSLHSLVRVIFTGVVKIHARAFKETPSSP